MYAALRARVFGLGRWRLPERRLLCTTVPNIRSTSEAKIASSQTEGVGENNEREKRTPSLSGDELVDLLLKKGANLVTAEEGRDNALIYWSPESPMLRTLSYLGTVAGGLSFIGGIAASASAVAACRLHGFEQWWEESAVWDIAGTSLSAGVFGASVFAVQKLASSVVVKIERQKETLDTENGEKESEENPSVETLAITVMSFPTGTKTTVHERSSVAGAPYQAIRQTLEIHDVQTRKFKRLFLAPMKGWKTEDHDYLKRLLYGAYFRPEMKRRPDRELIQIEGFGPYRPCEFADPTHDLALLAAERGIDPAEITARGYRILNGEVVGDFRYLPTRSVEERRREKSRRRLGIETEDEASELLPAQRVLPSKEEREEASRIYSRVEPSHAEFLNLGEYAYGERFIQAKTDATKTGVASPKDGGELQELYGGRQPEKETIVKSVYSKPLGKHSPSQEEQERREKEKQKQEEFLRVYPRQQRKADY